MLFLYIVLLAFQEYVYMLSYIQNKVSSQERGITNALFDWDKVNTLIKILRSQGISYLIGDDSSVNDFDWYSTALSKMQRANQQDIVDMRLLVSKRFVYITELHLLFREVLTKIGTFPYIRLFPNLSQKQFLQHYRAVRQLL